MRPVRPRPSPTARGRRAGRPGASGGASARSRLPGPPAAGVFAGMDLVAHPAVHREATRLVNRYGPLFKLRIVMFHVRGLRPRAAQLSPGPIWVKPGVR